MLLTPAMLLLQTLQGQFVLRAKLTAVVDSVISVSGTVEHDLTSAEALASYESIHPLYLQAKARSCMPCSRTFLHNRSGILLLRWLPIEEAGGIRWLLMGRGNSLPYGCAHHGQSESRFIWLVGRTCKISGRALTLQ